MGHGKHKSIWLEIIVIVASVLSLMLLVYFVMIVSFQNGATSNNVTMRLAYQIAGRIFNNPTEDQIKTTSLMIRYGAHLGLFFIVGLVTTFVSMVIFRRYFRILGVIGSMAICYALAYYTEYYKQFVEGRHFQMSDATLNWYGSLAGILCMVGSYFLNRLLVKLSS
ncbi:MAG: VanZ family protein [Lachnospiraceae bacterium]|nr:VanZ family protein [Lachnospiraceae bacterium]